VDIGRNRAEYTAFHSYSIVVLHSRYLEMAVYAGFTILAFSRPATVCNNNDLFYKTESLLRSQQLLGHSRNPQRVVESEDSLSVEDMRR
jgi:hypothetical protein